MACRQSASLALSTLQRIIAISFLTATGSASLADSSSVEEILGQPIDIAYGEYLASECVICHNPDGNGTSVPNIHGESAEKIAEALLAFRSGKRINSGMQNVASALGDEEIASLAAYLSISQPTPETVSSETVSDSK